MGKSSSIAILAVIIGPMLFGLCVSALLGIPYPILALVAGTAAILGVTLLVMSKWPKLCSGDFFSFGPATTKPRLMKYYLAAYGFIVLTICSSTALISSLAVVY